MGVSPLELELRGRLGRLNSDCKFDAWPGDVVPDVDGVVKVGVETREIVE